MKRCEMLEQLIAKLERRGIVTTDPSEAERCCGIHRDDDGFCQHRSYHPIYVPFVADGGAVTMGVVVGRWRLVNRDSSIVPSSIEHGDGCPSPNGSEYRCLCGASEECSWRISRAKGHDFTPNLQVPTLCVAVVGQKEVDAYSEGSDVVCGLARDWHERLG